MLTFLLALSTMQQAAIAAAGTYDVTFCVSTCAEGDTSLALAKGVVVLEATPIREPAGTGDMSACVRVERLKKVYGYLAMVSPAHTKWWSEAADSVGFTTYQTPDATHIVTARLANGRLEGSGSSEGEGLAEVDVADEYVIGRRTGPPDPKQCRFAPASPGAR